MRENVNENGNRMEVEVEERNSSNALFGLMNNNRTAYKTRNGNKYGNRMNGRIEWKWK